MKYLILIPLIAVLFSCKNSEVDPDVNTLRVSTKNSVDDLQVDMAVELYRHFINSDKKREFYEVISKKRGEILNYNPAKKILTACGDPGSGWMGQFKEVDLKTLKRIGDNKITFYMYYDSLTRNPTSEYIRPKTNGRPEL